VRDPLAAGVKVTLTVQLLCRDAAPHVLSGQSRRIGAAEPDAGEVKAALRYCSQL